MNGKHYWSAFNDPKPCATFKRLFTDSKKQVWIKTSTKKRNRIRKIGMAVISLLIATMLLILSRL